MVDIATQGLEHFSCLPRREGGRSNEGLRQVTSSPGFGGQAGALPDRVGQHDGQSGRGQGDQGVDGDPQRIEVRPASSEFISRPGGDTADPQGGGDACRNIGLATRLRLAPGNGCGSDGGGSRALEGRGRLACDSRQFHGGDRVRHGLDGGFGDDRSGSIPLQRLGRNALVGLPLLFQQAAPTAFRHRTFGLILRDGQVNRRLAIGWGRSEVLVAFRGLDGFIFGQFQRRPIAGFHQASSSIQTRRINAPASTLASQGRGSKSRIGHSARP